ncbi:MAG: TlpA disulfide reductase family protein [Thermaerobacter sp.]|nr:TlpA disulfide reductase family protein [Thermaerobacter sp.]
MRRYRPYLIGTIVFAALLAIGFLGLRPVPSAPKTVGIQVGQIAPDWKLPRLDGHGSIRLASLRGQPVWVNFFASWCPPCNAEAPGIAKVAAQNPGLKVIGVDLTASEKSTGDVQAFVKKYHIGFPVVLDTQNSVANRYQVQFIPTSFFIDRQGVIQAVVQSPVVKTMIPQYLAKIGFTPK